MRISGVGFPSYGATATWAITSGAALAALPASNLSVLLRPTQVMRCTTASAEVLWSLPAAQWVRLIALIHHNLQAAATIRMQIYNGPSGTGDLIYDSGTQPAWPGQSGPVAGYKMTQPFVLPAALQARSGRITIVNDGVNVEIGAVEIADFWRWPGILPGLEVGFDARSPVTRLAGGMDNVRDEFSARVSAGEVNLDVLESTSTGLEFQRVMDQERPFVWVPNMADPASWPRTCMLVRNKSIDPLVGSLYRRDSFPFSFIEHLR